ncbi:cell division ATPase MinD [Halobacterium litoreum]|uniref:Cell division ATPase MinD n=1 Tax=Halobacterium litoreum TaxID=2039234 RepID=A0ABD5NEF5_9EURY|nr:cell division ATPase MinD [Halobacterium litoreum]UHH13551.1 cell division ATPase MinD [Halobacterium litoreum]
MTGRVFAVASGKGGVGKTTTAVNAAAAMAEAGRSVVLVDYDLGMANVGAVLDVEQADATLHDVLAGEADAMDAVAEAPGGFDVMVGGTDIEDFGRADPSKLRDVAGELREKYDVVIVDTGGGLSHDTTVPLGLADDTVLVSTPQVAALENTEKTLELVERVGGSVAGLVLTRVGASDVNTDEAVDAMDVDVLGTVPEDSTVAASEEAGEPLLEYAPESPAGQSYRELGYELLGESPPVSFRDGDGEESAAANAALSEMVDDSGDGGSRSLLSRVTGGLLGSNGNK